MKDPSEAHYALEYDGERNVCADDYAPWPCKTVRKWRKSKTFKIAELQTLLDSLAKGNADLAVSVDAIRRELRRVNVVQRAMLDWLGGIDPRGEFEIVSEVEHQEVHLIDDIYIKRVPTLETFKVRYGGEQGEWRS